MRILFINSVCGIGSTGRVCTELAEEYEAEGHEVKIAYGRGVVPERSRHWAVRIGTDMDVYLHGVRTRFLDEHGFGSKRATREFLRWADSYDPDLLWLHNIHGYYINIEQLFDWIKKRPQMQVKWTLHDCWTFTGHCAHFTIAKCDKWKSHCEHCCQKSAYPASCGLDNCFGNFERKRAVFTGVENLTIITPSRWLAGLVDQSFLKEYPVEVINNTVDTNIFKPTPSDFRERNGLQDKRIILGVASPWSEKKGLNDFFQLAGMLDDRYKIVLVGLSKKQLKRLPEQVVGICRTNDVHELAAIYTAADVFVNPTYEDNYPSVNLEARACGTPVITYDTGGSGEAAGESGTVVETGDLGALYQAIVDHVKVEAPCGHIGA